MKPAEANHDPRAAVLDELLILRFQSGESVALDTLASRWNARLFRHACRLTRDRELASDALQDAWLAIARGLHRLQDPTRFPGWAHRIVANKCRDAIRKLQRRRRLTEEIAQEPKAEAMPPFVEPSVDPRLAALRAAMAALPDDRRMLLSLFYLEQMNVDQIALALDLPAGTVKSRLFYCRRKLRAAIEHSSETT
ncbi:MAG: RNA polymerase sigma factor [Thermoanaerobaculia bacterium]|nr:RNA polymerase sigma factor [Thermoanaerobaculia bacterium]